ncbi:hypothetical protein HZH68_015258 [Vespula germanica]|uniref:Uncharacterized protein n=1 Tax=Vespula germanica TaxID=30212 RepID=A0A834MST4_VESGE|nr:hypothetical protein HZH68_015258 [Vespula germanica]
MEFSCHQEDRSTWSRSLSRIVVARAAKRRGALHLSHNHLESDPFLGSDSASGARPTNPRASKIAYLREAGAFASKSLGGGVNNGRATYSIALILLSDRHLRPDLRRLRYTGGKGDGSKSADEKAAVPVGVANLAPVREGWIARTTRNCYRYASTRFPVSFDVSQPQTVPTVDYRST